MNKQGEWEQARYYFEWSKRQGFSKEAMLLIPNWHKFQLSRQERRIIRGIILEHFKTEQP